MIDRFGYSMFVHDVVVDLTNVASSSGEHPPLWESIAGLDSDHLMKQWPNREQDKKRPSNHKTHEKCPTGHARQKCKAHASR